jgi:cytosolic carboxypeptidase protein 6
LARKWIAALAKAMPNYRFRTQAASVQVPASMIWMNQTFGIPTVTYEVGDATSRATMTTIAHTAADALMTLLLDQP